MAAAIQGSAAFLFPLALIFPLMGTPPVTRYWLIKPLYRSIAVRYSHTPVYV
jgi:hypothetical protein